MNDYLNVLKKYAVFNGRASRKELWMFTLFNIIIGLALYFVAIFSHIFVVFIFYYLYYLAMVIPGIAVGIRRFHDTNHSAWWILIGLIPIIGVVVILVFFVMDSQPGQNQYGPNPKAQQPII